MANQWKDGQMRGFAAWCNWKLMARSLRVESLIDFHDGVLLIALIEILSGKKIEGYVAKPDNKKIVKINNVTLALQALSDLGISISGISAAAFVDGDVSCTLALVWSIIQFYQLDHAAFGTNVAGTTYNAKLLHWLKHRLEPYELPVESVKGFKDGLYYCALVHSFNSEALDFAKLDKSASSTNLELAFSTAEKVMGIPRLLQPSDLSETVVDENLIVVYISFFVRYDPTKKTEVSPRTTTNTKSEPSTRAPTTTTTTTTTTTKTASSIPHFQSTALFRRKVLDLSDPSATLLSYFVQRVTYSSDDDIFFFKREAQWKRKSWQQCGILVRRAARALISLGVQMGEKVCIFGKTRYEWTVFYLAALSVGAVPVSIGSSSSSKQEITHILNHSESVVILLEKQSQFKKVKGLTKSLQHVRHIITREKDSGKKGLSWRHFLRKGEGPEAARLDAEVTKRLEIITPDTLAVLIYSPGTEAETRNAVMYSHRNLLWAAAKLCERMQITGDDSYVSFLSMSHVVEQIMAVVLPVMAGLQVNYARDITCLSDTLKESQPSVLVAPPEYWFSCYLALKAVLPTSGLDGLNDILIDQVRKSVGCGRVRVALVGGNSQPCPQDVFTFFAGLGIQLVQSYGQLETTGLTTLNMVGPSDNKFQSLGKPIEGVDVKIGTDGEILIKGPNLFQGYFKDSELTSSRVVDGWYHSGDLGRVDEDGYLYFDGRKSDVLKLADGQSILPLKLETDLRAAPLTKYAIAVGEGKENAGVLLILDSGVVKRLAKKKGCSAKRLLNNPEILHQIKQHVETVSKAHGIKVRRFSIVPRNLSVKKGELTSTMSLRRKTIYTHFATDIENLYTKEAAKTATGGLDLVGNEALKKSASMEDAKTQPKKITDGCFYRKTSTGEFKKTELKQNEVEEMERQLMVAMKEIRELAKRIKTLQEQHIEDAGVLEAKESTNALMAAQLSDSDDSDGQGKKDRMKKSGDSLKKKAKMGKDKESGNGKESKEGNKGKKKKGH